MNRTTLLLTLVVTLSAACDSSTPPSGGVSLGQEFDLPAGQAATVEGELLVVTFDAVTADSRCPIGVFCIQAGEAVVSLEARRLPSTTASLVLKTQPETEALGFFQDYEIRLVELRPHPRLGETIAPRDYVATLLVRRP
jgi:hypothetical protein